MSMSLRVKKYFIETSFSSPMMYSLADCSKGRRMFTPKERSRPGALEAGGHDPGPGAR